MTKLWHDDCRRPPDASWVWARTNAEAIEILLTEPVEEVSLDHDLGLEYVDPDAHPESIAWAGRSPQGTGLDLVQWMCENGRVPAKVTVHSWNPVGARQMAARFADFGHAVTVQPFAPAGTMLLDP